MSWDWTYVEWKQGEPEGEAIKCLGEDCFCRLPKRASHRFKPSDPPNRLLGVKINEEGEAV